MYAFITENTTRDLEDHGWTQNTMQCNFKLSGTPQSNTNRNLIYKNIG